MTHFLELSFCCPTERVDELEAKLGYAEASSIKLQNGECSHAKPIVDGRWRVTKVTALFPLNVDLVPLRSTLSQFGCTDVRVDFIDGAAWQKELVQTQSTLNIGRFTVSAEPSTNPSDRVEIVLSPGMAFGTGEHATTALCLEWLGSLSLIGKHVLDLGCGSGILAIAAAKHGAASANAVDNDSHALKVAAENAEETM